MWSNNYDHNFQGWEKIDFMTTHRSGRKRNPKGKESRRPEHARTTGGIPAAEFKARCLKLVEIVRKSRRQLIVTRHGRPIAKVVPYEREAEPVFGFLRGTVTRYTDLISPIDEEWNADAS